MSIYPYAIVVSHLEQINSTKARFLGREAAQKPKPKAYQTHFFCWTLGPNDDDNDFLSESLNFRKYRSCDFVSGFVALRVDRCASATKSTSSMRTFCCWKGEKSFCFIFKLCLFFLTRKVKWMHCEWNFFLEWALHAKQASHSHLRFVSSIGVFFPDWACPFSIWVEKDLPLVFHCI